IVSGGSCICSMASRVVVEAKRKHISAATVPFVLLDCVMYRFDTQAPGPVHLALTRQDGLICAGSAPPWHPPALLLDGISASHCHRLWETLRSLE
ncbi:hypothetical protein KIPB_003608, partial [Kipferlia bialata]